MRNRIKQQILELLGTAEEAIAYLQKSSGKKTCLLEDCSASIAAIYRVIVDAQGEHALLCGKMRCVEAALKSAEQAKETNPVVLRALALDLAVLRRKIAGMRTKLEIVFLPYKASMWDAFESIWRAATTDPDCEVFVLPIPYYDLDEARNAQQMHYEGDCFPPDVPIVDFRVCDLAARRPDIIYIHNPYDGYNRVTSVAPEFYAERLRTYTDLLVYIPYFVAFDAVGEHFCQTPGVLYADRIVVQSEKARETYARFVSAAKVLALGSPKIDKVLFSQTHCSPMPAAWQRIARGRKLVLYNTHLSPLIADAAGVCQKLRWVFERFKKREDVCLLWRPHPLSEATLQAMQPQLLAEYRALVAAYREASLGIYDDSPDVHRAIALSDAYYGDWSSLVPLYGVTGKPILLQELQFCSAAQEAERRALSFADAVDVDGALYFAAGNCNGLFRLEAGDEEAQFIGAFPEEPPQGQWLFSKALRCGEKLFFVPWTATKLMEYDLKTNVFRAHALPKTRDGACEGVRFVSALYRDEWIWLLPGAFRGIVKFHPATGAMRLLDDWCEALPDAAGEFFSPPVCLGDALWCGVRRANFVAKLNLRSERVSLYEVGPRGEAYQDIAHDGICFWLVPRSGTALVRWEPQSGVCDMQTDFPASFAPRQYGLGPCCQSGGKMWIFTYFGDEAFVLHFADGRIARQAYPEGFCFLPLRTGLTRFWGVRAAGEKVLAFPSQGNMLLEIDVATGAARGRRVALSPEAYAALAARFWAADEEKLYREADAFCDLDCFLQALAVGLEARSARAALYLRDVNDGQTDCGRRIHRRLAEEARKASLCQ